MNRVVVTAMGIVSPIGEDVSAFHAALNAGISGVGPITRFDPGTLPTQIAAEIKSIAPDTRNVRTLIALKAASEAMRGIELAPHARAGLSIGLGLEVFSMEEL